jgi:Na+/melibiose symporter-like transporter
MTQQRNDERISPWLLYAWGMLLLVIGVGLAVAISNSVVAGIVVAVIILGAAFNLAALIVTIARMIHGDDDPGQLLKGSTRDAVHH